MGGIKQTLTKANLPPFVWNPKESGKTYEIYILSRVAEAADRVGASWEIKDGNLSKTGGLHVRKSPGVLHSPDRTYTHIEIQFDDDRESLEAHIGIRFRGQSGVDHETDVVLLRHSLADFCRKTNQMPPGPKAIWTAECKHLSGTIGVGLAREALGLTVDLSPLRQICVTNTEGATWRKLLASYGRNFMEEVEPNSTAVMALEDELERILREYKQTGG